MACSQVNTEKFTTDMLPTASNGKYATL